MVAGNWKMNGLRRDGKRLASDVTRGAHDMPVDLAICPPATLLSHVAEVIRNSRIMLGAQDCHPEQSGAHTGDISAPMLADLGCRVAIVGHSERRTAHKEGDALVRAKAMAVHGCDMIAIICIGETEAQRDEGVTLDVIEAQLRGSVPPEANAANTVIAYEPVWAIGTGRTPTPEQIQEVHAHIRRCLGSTHGADVAEGTRLLYGGSVKPANAAELMALADVDGALVGGASLAAAEFLAIARSCP